VRVLIIADVHANRTAFEGVLASAGSFDSVWHLGDIVGYGPDPAWCVDCLIDLNAAASLSGNHDLAAVDLISTDTFNPLAELAARWNASQLTPDHRAYLTSLPAMTKVDGVTLAHGSPRDPVREYIVDPRTATENFARFTTSVCFVGHTHIPCSADLNPDDVAASLRYFSPGSTLAIGENRWIVNPGSVGQPRDGDPRAAFVIFDTDAATVASHRVEYDIGAVQRRMEAAGLPTPLADRLAKGR